MKNNTCMNSLNEFELNIIEEFESISSQFPEVSNETLIYETVRRLNLLKDKRKLTRKDKMFLNLYNNGCLKR